MIEWPALPLHSSAEVRAPAAFFSLRAHAARIKHFRCGSGFSDATRGRLGDAERCLASEKRSSGKSRGWAWLAVCCYGDLGCGLALDLI
tara:strand:+ start:2758 stop:3024 length:267 start_codon:yes stop_codon:yes gene_type:complete